jgi:predicted porin
MNKTIILSIFFYSFSVKAQDNLLNLLSQDNEPIYISYLFKGTKVVNGQSVELPSKGVLQFIIQHRFGTLNSGFYNLYGLDNSQVRLGFDYGFKDFLAVGLGRSSTKTIDANSKLRIKRQIKDGFPVTIVANFAAYVKQWQYTDNQLDNFLFTNQLSFAHQLLIASKINRDFTLQISPTLIHYNLVETLDEPNDKYSLGLGGRYKITKRISVNAEYFYQLNDKINNNVLSFGFDIETGGHVFQLHLSNSAAMFEGAFIHETNGNWLEGDIYFGFNISRVFTLNK